MPSLYKSPSEFWVGGNLFLRFTVDSDPAQEVFILCVNASFNLLMSFFNERGRGWRERERKRGREKH